MKYKKNIISNVIVHILSISLGFFSSILIARGLGAANQGQFSFYVLIFGLISTYGHFGFSTSISYFLKKTKYKDEDIVNSNITVLLILGLLYFIILILLKNYIFNNNSLILLVIWTVYYNSILISTCLMNIFMANENVYIYNRYLNIISILKLILVASLFFTKKINVVSVSIVYAFLEFCKLLLMLNGLKLNYKVSIKKNILIQELKYGIPLYLSALFLYLNYRADQLMIKYYINNTALGIYALSVTLAELAKMVPDSFVSAFTGKLYNCSLEEKKNIVVKTIKLSFYMTVIISIIGICCKPLIVILYGKEFAGAGLSMIILLIGIPFLTVGKVSSVYFYTHGKTKIHMFVSLLVLIINLFLNIVLIPKYGIYGAALTSSLSYLFYAIVYLIVLQTQQINYKDIILINNDDINFIKKQFSKFKLKYIK